MNSERSRIERMALYAGALGDHAEARLERPDIAMQLDRGLDDALPRLGLAFGPLFQRIAALLHFHYTTMCIEY